MHRLLLTGGLCLALGACATTTPAPNLPTCNGQHRRPANPSGSILLVPDTTPRPAPGAPASGKPHAAPGATYAPCGDPS